MEGNARTRFTPKQRAELWERWKSGQCVADIARALERRNKSGVYRVLAVNGGIAPAPRRRTPVALRLEEREEISRGIVVGRSIRRIAQGLGRSPSTISREIKRNGGCSAYRASEADTRTWERALRARSLVAWRAMRSYDGMSRRSSHSNGSDNGTGDMGKLPVIRTVATLAHDCRRTELFQRELIAALQIVQRGDLPLRDLVGAYAGEIGQTQFLPSSYIKYGVDYDGNGHVDLRHSVPDVLASTANLLKTNGWRAGAPFTAGTPNFEVAMREWNHSEVYRKTIVLMAQRLGGG
jgi:hypothetical protein